MPETNSDPFTPPQVQDKRTRPLGILPQNMQVRVMGGVAVLMIVVIALSGRNSQKEKHVSAPPQTIMDPNTARIQEYEKAVAEQTQVDDQHRAADHRQGEQMDRLDDGKCPRRRADRMAGGRCFAPLSKRQERHGYR